MSDSKTEKDDMVELVYEAITSPDRLICKVSFSRDYGGPFFEIVLAGVYVCFEVDASDCEDMKIINFWCEHGDVTEAFRSAVALFNSHGPFDAESFEAEFHCLFSGLLNGYEPEYPSFDYDCVRGCQVSVDDLLKQWRNKPEKILAALCEANGGVLRVPKTALSDSLEDKTRVSENDSHIIIWQGEYPNL